jgi:membrane protease YdiL (CAAX protease family)
MDLLQGSFVVGFGLYIGYVAEKAGSIRPTMVCHAVNNSIQVLLGRLSTGGDEPMHTSQAVLVALIALAVLLVCTAYIYFRVNARADRNGATAFPAASVA